MKASNGSVKRKAATRGARSTAQAAAPSERPFANLNFAVAIERMKRSGAVEVLLPTARIVEGSDPGRRSVQLDALVVRRGLTTSTEWYDWWDAARRSTRDQRRLVSVIVRHDSGAEGMRWLFPDTVPIAYSVSPLHSLFGAPLLESLELKVGGFQLYERE